MLKAIKRTFLISLVAFAIGVYIGDTLPSRGKLDPRLEYDPIQEKTDKIPFDATVNNITYSVNPLYSYELYGLVVSRYKAGGFTDHFRKRWNDHLNKVDLCVVWGRNAFSGIYERLEFSSGEFKCYVRISSLEDRELFSGAHFSNNHMLSDRRDIVKALRKARIGDQVHFTGYLVEYSHGDFFFRGTSVVRTDTGSGACETVYVEDFSIIKSGPRLWLIVRRLALVALLGSIVAWFCAPDRYHAGN